MAKTNTPMKPDGGAVNVGGGKNGEQPASSEKGCCNL